MPSRQRTSGNKKMSNECLSSSTLEIVVDDELSDDSIYEDSNSQTKHPNSASTDDEQMVYRPRKQAKFKNQKSHRVIEKRRRDRMNRSLNVLLDLIPHKKPESQRRIEKTEIIEMAVKYIRSLISSTKKSFEPIILDKKSNLKMDAYRFGYHNGLSDAYEYIEKHSNNDQFLPDLIHYVKQKEIELKNLIVVPDKRPKEFLSKQSPHTSCDTSKSDDNLCAVTDIRISENSLDEQQNSIEKIKVPIFVLHPSGTHYIPMCIDSSLVSQVFNNKSNISKSNEQLQCHPVSIPVNFNPTSVMHDPYELDIQNINVIATRHKPSVRPN